MLTTVPALKRCAALPILSLLSGRRLRRPCICCASPGKASAFWSRLEIDALRLADLDARDAGRMRDLMEKYRDLPMDLADAALVRVAERDDITRVFTLDRRHFSLYRPGRRRRFAIFPA